MSNQIECLMCNLKQNYLHLAGWDEADGSRYAKRGQVVTHQRSQEKLPQERYLSTAPVPYCPSIQWLHIQFYQARPSSHPGRMRGGQG